MRIQIKKREIIRDLQIGLNVLTIYGIKTCDTVRKAVKWAEAQNIEFLFHDFRKSPVSIELIKEWDDAVGREVLVNKKGTTYRKLSDAQKDALQGTSPFDLLQSQPTIMKRPVFHQGDTVVVGFAQEQKEKLEAMS